MKTRTFKYAGHHSCIADMLFRGLIIASNPNIYLETLAGIWNGSAHLTVYEWPGIRARGLSLHPLPVPPPLPSSCQWAGGQMIPVSIDCQALNSLNSVLRWTKAVSLLETWTSKNCFLISRLRISAHWKYHHIHHLSSPLITSSSRNPTTFVNPLVKVIHFTLLPWFRQCFAMIVGFSLHQSFRCKHYLLGHCRSIDAKIWCVRISWILIFLPRFEHIHSIAIHLLSWKNFNLIVE